VRVTTRRWDGADARALARELRSATAEPAGLREDVAAVLEQVRGRGDEALLDLCEKLDGARPERLLLGADALAEALASVDPELRSALELAAANIRTVAEAQMDDETTWVSLPQGQEVGTGSTPVGSAGIYAPGGRGTYPSSVLMGVIPARVAGVERVLVASPPRGDGTPEPGILAAAAIAGADGVVAAGGAHAVAALAYGTETVDRVDVIAGPGGPWVQEAKLQASREVGIDGYAGPSELMVICDAGATSEWLALDLCAQAEHGPDSLLVVAGTDAAALEAIGDAVTRLAAARDSVQDAALELVEVPSLTAAAELAVLYAPEHLELDCADAEELAASIPTAGCIFEGASGATAFGDYAAGSNHTLPTGGAGRFTGPLGPGTFRRRTSRVRMAGGSAAELADAVSTIAEAEGFPVHGESARARGEAGGPAEGSS
jgi:histidinol dehydrogenase